MRAVLIAMLLATNCTGAAMAQPTDADPALVEEGQHVAMAGDCAGCHGTSLAGGDPVASPIGDIYASNITPDTETGIGAWTLAQFSYVLRKGKSPTGHIYPAMPYTSYTGLDDGQIAALYSYLMLGVDPVRNVPQETTLPFPFMRPAMIGWNMLFLDEGKAVGAVPVTDDRAMRGRVLVESLGHCTACHTPRGSLMEPLSGRHLGGGMVDGWWAPNITPGEGGIGGWSDKTLATFLRTGHTERAVAAGEMGTVVSRSLSHLPDDDIGAIVAYLRAVPAVASKVPGASASTAAEAQAAMPDAGLQPSGGWQEMVSHDTLDGGQLYQSACASCHGIDGRGSRTLAHPSLRQIGSVTAPQGSTLVQVIAAGVNRTVNGTTVLMPGFRASLNDAQIAALANHVRATFGGVSQAIEPAQVSTLLKGSLDTPWLIRNATWLAIAGLVIAALVLIVLIWVAVRLWGRSGARHA